MNEVERGKEEFKGNIEGKRMDRDERSSGEIDVGEGFKRRKMIGIEDKWREEEMRKEGGEGEVWKRGVINIERGEIGKIKKERNKKKKVKFEEGEVEKIGSKKEMEGMGDDLIMKNKEGCCIIMRMERKGKVMIGLMKGD